MSDTSVGDLPWQGDACGLVEAFRSSRRSPSEELEATLAAIERSDLNAFAFLDVDGARASAAVADVTLPFGGVPLGIKELDKVAGWPDTEASIPLSERKATYTLTHIERLVAAGAEGWPDDGQDAANGARLPCRG